MLLFLYSWLGKSQLLVILAEFGNFLVTNCAEIVKRHIYTQRPIILAYKFLPEQAHVSKIKSVFGHFDKILPTFGGEFGQILLKGTSSHLITFHLSL